MNDYMMKYTVCRLGDEGFPLIVKTIGYFRQLHLLMQKVSS